MPSAVIEKVRKERPRDYLKVAVAGVGSMSSTISDGRHILHAKRCHDYRTIDEYGISQHGVNELIVRQLWIVEPKFIIGRAFTLE